MIRRPPRPTLFPYTTLSRSAVTPEPQSALEPEPTPEPAMAEPVASTASADDPLGGMDPMAWLESLAARQGASADEITTESNPDTAEPPADTAVCEPGYTPGYDVGKSSFAAQSESSKAPAPEPEPTPEPAYDFAPASAPAAPVPAASTAIAADTSGGRVPQTGLERRAP